MSTSPVPGYAVEDVMWKVQATPGGAYLLINGTVQDVFNQLRQVNPTFEADFDIDIEHPSSTQMGYLVDTYDCWEQSSYAKQGTILDQGVPYLRAVPGKPAATLGPGVCGRVSCSWNSAIWWCIQVADKQLDSFGAIADGAEYVANTCQANMCQFLDCETFTMGRVFYTDGWSVVVQGDHC